MENRTKLIVLGLIQNDTGQYLLSQRYDLAVSEAHLKWDLIGGTNEYGETLEQTLHREIFEEAGLQVEILDLFPKSTARQWRHTDYNIHAVVLCYHCRWLSGELTLGDPKINSLKWVGREELKDYEFLPTTQPFIDLVVN